jgi:transcriptional regulator with XRE-family HTH domain
MEAKPTPNDLLRRHRKLHAWSQEKLAEFLQTDASLVRKWERGVVKPRPYHQEKLCDLFGVTADQLGFIEELQVGGRVSSHLGSRGIGSLRTPSGCRFRVGCFLLRVTICI